MGPGAEEWPSVGQGPGTGAVEGGGDCGKMMLREDVFFRTWKICEEGPPP